MRENEQRLCGAQWGMFSIFEAAEPRCSRVIDQSIVAWRLASKSAGAAAFENPRSVIQRTFSMVTCGPNREHHRQRDYQIRYNIGPYSISQLPYNPEEVERAQFNHRPAAPIPYHREDLLRWHADQAYNSEEFIAPVPVRMTAEQVERAANRREGGFRYPTAAEVADIERRFHSPELEHAMEAARQEILRRERDFYEHMRRIISEPAPPGFREAMEAVREIHAD